MSVYSVWPYFVLVPVVFGLLALPVFRGLDEPQRDQRTATLDGLRGFLALSVFVHHLVITHAWLLGGKWTVPPSGFYTLLGQAGVAVFFMITGFLFWGKLLDTRGRPGWTALYVGRIFRIGPMYLFVVALMFFIVAWRTGFALREPAWTVLGAVAQWLALGMAPTQPDINGYAGTGLILAGVTWTIFVEWLFYGSLWLMAPVARRGRPLRFMVGALSVGLLALAYAAANAVSFSAATPALIVGLLGSVLTPFFLGMLSAWLVRRPGVRRARLPEWAASLTALACLAAVFTGFEHMLGPVQTVLLAIFFHLVCSGSTLFGLLSTRPARRLSTISYSIYLLQGVVLTVVLAPRAVRDFAMAGAAQYWLVGLVCGLLLAAASAITYRWVEQPGVALGRRMRAGRTRAPAAQPQAVGP